MSAENLLEPSPAYYRIDQNDQSTFTYGNQNNQFPEAPPSYNEATNQNDQLQLTYENQNPGSNQHPSPSDTQYPGNQYQPQYIAHGQEKTSMVTQPGAMVMERAPVTHNWMGPAVLACLCCFWPTGICAIIAASNANEAAAYGDVLEAERQSRRARSYVTTSFLIGITLIAIVVVYRVVHYYPIMQLIAQGTWYR
ncbi:synapse differentiation-inducing gene protein 1-like isoform X1 [Crassostrea angulata]|uniref:synapse differentiation-inducing gene protein 1-like isoform X1 n=1 Tax=Magallana angulata TaxID=2784310 RepID=UPI0022B15FC5|nr:synapse differentiation-inducing gene protein 1-like isoform X1 [Crassostrea angulata]